MPVAETVTKKNATFGLDLSSTTPVLNLSSPSPKSCGGLQAVDDGDLEVWNSSLA